MPVAVSSRIRPATDLEESSSIPPPAKRRKASPSNSQPNGGYAELLLNDKSRTTLAPGYTTKGRRLEVSNVSDQNAVISTGLGSGDVEYPVIPEPEVVELSSDASSDFEDEHGDVKMDAGMGSGEQAADQEAVAEEVAPEEVAREEGATQDHINNTNLNGKRAASQGLGEEDANEEPSFGERLQGQHEAVEVNVETALAKLEDESSDERDRQPSRPSRSRSLLAPSAATLGTVLTQALRTNDRDLLESCFEMNDLEGVRETISRLESKFITTLLVRIAERISKRPGRLGNLMVWVQWSIVAHGGYLAGQPNVMAQIGTLIRVIKERANGLQPLLQLKGKLDMLQAQLDLRRDMQERTSRHEDGEEAAVTIYQEGESDVDGSDAEGPQSSSRRLKIKGMESFGGDESDDDLSDSGAFANGLVKGDVSDESGSSDDEGLFDDEAEETNDDEGDDESASGGEDDSEAAGEDVDSD